ncbi:MAG TPA: erythromycin esterase family protein [Steroidobacteraceae bacterium]|nr:erythromycin esterase family protein [Steroidobacteraceae bacterium]
MKPRLLISAAGALALLTAAPPLAAQAPDDVRTGFMQWARDSAHRVSDADLDASTKDLAPIEAMIGSARVVGLSEGQHAATEPLAFRNRVFRRLVENLGFRALAIESGIVESRVLNDYVTQGKGELDTVLVQGFSTGFDTFRQNRELIRWIRDYNARLSPDAARVQIYGIDVSGSPGNFDAARGPETALDAAIAYLSGVDPQIAAEMQRKVAASLPALKGTNGYGDLQQSDRDALTAAIADLVSLLERRRFAYIDASSKEEYEWAMRAAVAARQTDAWFRRMPIGWKLADGFAWTREAVNVRDRAMLDNLEWVLGRVGPRGRVLVFAASPHIAATPIEYPDGALRETVPFGVYARERFGPDYLAILNLIVGGEIVYCSANPRRVMPLRQPPPAAVENLFASVNVARYLLDLRRAPPRVSSWLQQPHDHWNGFAAARFPTAAAFDIAYFVSPITSACVNN